MKTKKKLVALLAMSMFLMTMPVSCVKAGRQFSTEAVREIAIGRTSKEDVRRMFGNPYRTGIEDGQDTWTYGRYKWQLFERSEASDLVIRFDATGVVTSYSFSTTDGR